MMSGKAPQTGRLRLVLVCVSIAANALCAGGVYSFPLISPALVSHMKFTQPQLTTIALAGMVGQYPFAAFVGKILDRYGPRICSLLASILFSLGLGLFSWEIANTPNDISVASNSSFRRLAVYFGMAGLATVLSYFSLVFSSTRIFPHYMGIASGTSMAIFGFSPLLLSVIASTFFTDPETGLNVANFLGFLAALTGVIHLFGAVLMPGPEKHLPLPSESTPLEEEDGYANSSGVDHEVGDLEERRPLLVDQSKVIDETEVEVFPVQEPRHGSVGDLLRDPFFWLLATITMIIVGAAEMVMANLGSIYLSLSRDDSSPNVSSQVQLLSASNTMTRLLVGPLADYVAPVAAYLHNGVWSFPRKQYISRIFFLVAASFLLALTFTWSEIGIRSRATMWSLSLGIGIVYGTIFTILPGILSSIWGLPNLGRNFGIISYAPFIGTTLFSYLYAFIAAAYTAPGEAACEGVKCWKSTFWLGAVLALVAAGGSGLLWRRWQGRV